MDVVDDTISDNYITKVPRITKINVAEQKQDSSPEGNLTMEVVDESEMRNLLFENMDFNVTGSDTTCEGPCGSRQGLTNTVRYSVI